MGRIVDIKLVTMDDVTAAFTFKCDEAPGLLLVTIASQEVSLAVRCSDKAHKSVFAIAKHQIGRAFESGTFPNIPSWFS